MPAERVQQILTAAMVAEAQGVNLPDALCSACAEALPVSGAALALMSSRGPEGLVAVTDDRARTMERLQFSLGEGPCVDASTRGRPVLQPDLRNTAPALWPGFGPAALEAGIEAIFAFPLQVGGIRLGVLDLYRDSAGTLNPHELEKALSYADASTSILLRLQDRQPAGDELPPDLIDRTGNLAEVHEATGMVAVQATVGLAEALLLLRARAFSSERSLLEVAVEVIAKRLRFPPEEGHHE